MSYNQRSQNNGKLGVQNDRFAMPRRSPSILVTDSRSSKNRIHAPFAGHAATSESRGLTNTQSHLRKQNNNSYGTSPYTVSYADGGINNVNGLRDLSRNSFAKSKMKRRSKGQFSDITLDNILSHSSDIPSGRREERRSSSSGMDRSSGYEKLRVSSNYRKMINPLPTRKSKISQKLVLIPEETSIRDNLLFSSGRNIRQNNSNLYTSSRRDSTSDNFSYSTKDKQNLARLTAYNIADGFNLKLMSKFLKETHEVSTRLYDDCLYVPYVLPLLPGKDGFRIKSNVSKKIVGGKTLIDKLIDTSEKRDHHYEYYSGVETLEDMNNNYELETNAPISDNKNDPGTVIPDHLPALTSNNPDSFDPSEPQFFAEENIMEDQEPLNRSPVNNKHSNRDSNVPVIGTSSDTLSGESRLNGQKSPRESTKDRDIANTSSNSLLMNQAERRHAEIFIFHYGVIVFWNFTEAQEKNILGDITFADYKNIIIRPLDEHDIEIEEFHFEYDMDTERPRIFNDVLTLRSGDHIIKLTLSYAIAQSSKLSRFESRISPILTSVTKLPKRLALYGSLGLKREQLLKKSGKLFKLRVDVNLSSSVLDTPDFFWSIEPSLHPLYVAMREYLEIDKRVQVVNDRCKVFLEFFDICVDSVAERNIARVTWWFIIVILLGVLFSLSEILVRYNIIHNEIS